MSENHKTDATQSGGTLDPLSWRLYWDALEKLGVDPYSPTVPEDDPRFEQVQAAIAEYRARVSPQQSLPPGWEGCQPLDPIENLANVARWLQDQWRSVRSTEMGGEAYTSLALDQALRAVRNGFRLLEFLGLEHRPPRPLLATTLPDAKKQIDNLEHWVRQKEKQGWKPRPRKATPC